MAISKLKNEKKVIGFFIFAAMIVFIVSAVFLFISIQKDELGGSFITAMLLFISGYGLIVFIARAVRYNFISKLQEAVLNEGISDISRLSENFGKSSESIEKQLNFLIDNGYLDGYSIVGGRVINEEAEELRLQMLEEQYYKKQMEMQKAESEKTARKTAQKKTIESEKCPNCGAKVKFENDSVICPYCGNSLKKE